LFAKRFSIYSYIISGLHTISLESVFTINGYTTFLNELVCLPSAAKAGITDVFIETDVQC
jgi:hypothetical protein